MRLKEFYNPNEDNFIKRDKTDNPKNKLTLKELNKLRKIRDIKKAEEIEKAKFARTMYAPLQVIILHFKHTTVIR